jgi:hypothetical protein
MVDVSNCACQFVLATGSITLPALARLRTNVDMRFVPLENFCVASAALDRPSLQGKLDRVDSITDTRRVTCCPEQRYEGSEGGRHCERRVR